MHIVTRYVVQFSYRRGQSLGGGYWKRSGARYCHKLSVGPSVCNVCGL